MRVLLEDNVNQRLAPLLVGHVVVHVRAVGLNRLQNGALIAAAEALRDSPEGCFIVVHP